MSMPKGGIPPIPEETIRIAQSAFPKGNVYMSMRDKLGSIFKNEDFVDLYPRVGQHGVAPWQLALVTVMQFAEDLTDREAANGVRGRIDWKYALGFELSDGGFDHSVLSEFRDRLIRGGAEHRLLEKMLVVCEKYKLLKTDGKQRTDATHVLAAVRMLNRLELVHETLRHTLNILAEIVPDWLVSQVHPEWFEHYGTRLNEYQLPKDKSERENLAVKIGRDGVYLLEKIYAEASLEWLGGIPAVETLRHLWIQAYYQEEGQIHWREKKNQPPASQSLSSPYDTQARYSTKRNLSWVGYKAHLTETCNPDTPNLIIQVETCQGTKHDSPTVQLIHQNLTENERLPQEHFVDASYMSADAILETRMLKVDLVGPVKLDSSWQARCPDGLDHTQFTIDWDQDCAICPQGKMSQSWIPQQDPRGYDVIKIKFRKSDCADCPLRAHCTRSKTNGRTLTIPTQERYEVLAEARLRQQTQDFKDRYATRAGIEGTVSQAALALGMRQARYRGLAKTHLQNVATATAINLLRVIAWLDDVPRSTTRNSAFAKLAA